MTLGLCSFCTQAFIWENRSQDLQAGPPKRVQGNGLVRPCVDVRCRV